MCNQDGGKKPTEFFNRAWSETGLQSEPNTYIYELATMLVNSAAPGLTLLDKEIQFLLYADDLVLLSPTKEGLQQNLDLLAQF